ncbi:MAG: TrkH family potassium uptake protein [Coriobacteriia bacterium]|nr:TrkH family potassium uptake protein [Coriobacteriia bacterium]
MWVTLQRRDVRTIAHYTGLLIVGIGLAMIVPLVTAVSLKEWAPALDYLMGMGISCAAGMTLALLSPKNTPLNRSNALIVTALAWLAASLVAALPLALSGNYGSYLDALFDAMSGLTTSGLTLVQDLDHLALSHNMWRHFTHLIGGQGIVVAAVSIAIGLRGGAMSLYIAEGRDEKILPNVMHTTRFIWFVTSVYVALGTIALTIVNLTIGMEPVRSGLHAFWATIATYDTGGFGPQSMNALYYHSGVFEFVTVVLMIAGTLNFNLHADVWRGDRGELFKNIEARAWSTNVVVLVVFSTLGLAATRVFTGVPEIIRKGVYHIFSANTGTGHQTLYAAQWARDYGGLAMGAVILAMAFGGMASSTAGGIKALRLGVIFKGIVWRIHESLAPKSAVITERFHHLDDRELTDALLNNALMVFMLYMFTYVTGALIGAAYGYPMGEALFESVSAAANVGLSTGITNPAMPTVLKLVYILQMWAGRLEFVALFALFASFVVSFGRRRTEGRSS